MKLIAYFAECSALCRVSKHGHSAKRQFVECRTRQSRHSVKAVFAECQTLGKEGHSANVLLPSVRLSAKNNPRQNNSGDAGGPSVILCRVLAVSTRQTCCLCQVLQAWHSAKYFYFFLFFFSNLLCGIYTIPWSICSNLELFYDFLVYFFNFLCLLEFFSKK